MPKKSKSLAALMNDAASSLQKLVRLKAQVNGYANCVSCGAVKHWKEMDGGHFYSRKDAAVKLLEENVHPQCKGCNLRMSHGDTKVFQSYRSYMVEMYGEDFLLELDQMARTTKKFTRHEIEEIKAEFDRQIRELEGK